MTNTLWQNITPATATAMIEGQKIDDIYADQISAIASEIKAGRTIWGGRPIQIINGVVVSNLEILVSIIFAPENQYIYCLVENDLTDHPVPDGNLFDQIAETAEQSIRLATGEQLDNFDKPTVELMCRRGKTFLNHPYLAGAILSDGMYAHHSLINSFTAPPALITNYQHADRPELPPAQRFDLARNLLIKFSYRNCNK